MYIIKLEIIVLSHKKTSQFKNKNKLQMKQKKNISKSRIQQLY